MVLDSKEFREIVSVLDMPKYREWAEIVEDYLTLIRKRMHNAWALYKVQESLVSDTIKAQDYQNLANENIKKIEDEISILVRQQRQDELRTKNEQRNEWARTRKFAHLIRKTVRNIGDCIAWKLLDYNRAWIGLLGDKEPIGKIEPSISLLNELSALYNHTVTDDNLALLNDLTNVIRISDITLRTRNGNYTLQEIKSSERQDRRTRKQEATRLNIINFFSSGAMKDDRGHWQITEFKTPVKTYFQELTNVFIEAEKKGIASQYLEDFFQVEAFFPDKIPKDSTEEYFHDNSMPWHPSWKKSDMIINLDTFSELKLDFRHYVPLGLFPLPIEWCAKLITGYMIIVSTLNLRMLADQLTQQKWHVEISTKGEEILDYTYKLRRGNLTQTFSTKLIGCLALQFMNKETIFSMLEEMFYNKPKNENVKYLFYFEDEKNAYA